MCYLLLSVFTSPDAAESFGPMLTKAPTPVRRDEAGAPQQALELSAAIAERTAAMPRGSHTCVFVWCVTWEQHGDDCLTGKNMVMCPCCDNAMPLEAHRAHPSTVHAQATSKAKTGPLHRTPHLFFLPWKKLMTFTPCCAPFFEGGVAIGISSQPKDTQTSRSLALAPPAGMLELLEVHFSSSCVILSEIAFEGQVMLRRRAS